MHVGCGAVVKTPPVPQGSAALAVPAAAVRGTIAAATRPVVPATDIIFDLNMVRREVGLLSLMDVDTVSPALWAAEVGERVVRRRAGPACGSGSTVSQTPSLAQSAQTSA